MVKRMLMLAASVPGMWNAIVNLRCMVVSPLLCAKLIVVVVVTAAAIADRGSVTT
jgi:hypothetical protein